MTIRRILATSGGFTATDRWGVMRPGGLMLEALRLTGVERPRVCLVMTASGDDASYLARSYAALGALGCDVDHLALFTMPNRDPEEILARSDVVWVGGGSVANLLALWRLHGVDVAMRSAWERGTILAGVSAGSICWHVGGPTDSFGPTLRVVTDALALVPYGNGVHYDSEEQRRPLLQRVVGDGLLPTSYATDDRIGILYEGDEAVRVIADLDVDPVTGPAAYRVERVAGDVVETRLKVGPIPA
ncbi:MAG: Type 1 glutamine amidotransferase-like domain-containing protein [Candidatus Nanopelagicales bacterium]|jgi:peptidase E